MEVATAEGEKMNRHIGKVTGVKRSYEGELQVDIDLKTGGYITKLPNTLSNFQMDEEVVIVTMRRSEADALYDNLSKAVEEVADDYGIDCAPLSKLLDAVKPEEIAQAVGV